MNGIGLSPAFRGRQLAFGALASTTNSEKRPSFTRTTDPAALETRGHLSDFHTFGAGQFRLLVVNGPTFLRDQFRAAFPQGLSANIAVTLVR